MHVKSHKLPCPWLRNPKYFKGCGLTDGETCERAWSILGRAALITRNMTSGNRGDMLERLFFHFYVENLKNQYKLMAKKLADVKIEINELLHIGFVPEVTDLHKRHSQIIELFAKRRIHGTEIEKHDLKIKDNYRKTLAINNRRRRKDHTLSSNFRVQLNNIWADVNKWIGERNSMQMTQELTIEVLQNESSWFWKDGLEIDDETIELWKMQERLFRLLEEKKMLESEMNRFESIETAFKTYLEGLPHLPKNEENEEIDADIEEILLDISEALE